MKLSINTDPKLTPELRELMKSCSEENPGFVGAFPLKEFVTIKGNTVTTFVGFMLVYEDSINYYNLDGICRRTHVLYTFD